MNPFQSSFHTRMCEWKQLRLLIRGYSLVDACVATDKWWQQAPLINHHLHWADSSSWPDPWTMLSENTYCTLTRAVGICYTLLMSDIIDVTLAQATNNVGEDHNLVMVGHAKYVLNYYPNTVVNNSLRDFTVKQHTAASKILKIIH